MTQAITILAVLIAIQSVATTIRQVARTQEQQRTYAGILVVGTLALAALFWWRRFETTPQLNGWTFNLAAALIAIGLSALLTGYEIIRRRRQADADRLRPPGLYSYLLAVGGIVASLLGLTALYRILP